MSHPLRLVYLADDFTGATDALEALFFAGLKVVLFLDVPGPDLLARFSGLDAIGVAGDSRAMTPTQMRTVLPAIFDRMGRLEPALFHYKVCSTFDSAEGVGSIGEVILIAKKSLAADFVPIFGGTPALGRYCAFGTLYARAGTDGGVHRLDRHPIMSVHPITPMKEADLARHIEKQGALRLGKLSLPELEQGANHALTSLQAQQADGLDGAVVDAVNEQHVSAVGDLLHDYAKASSNRFVVGGSGVEYAITDYLKRRCGYSEAAEGEHNAFGPARAVLAVSGSGSSLSALQVTQAIDSGYIDLAVDTPALVGTETANAECARLVVQAAAYLRQGDSVILHTVKGSDDPRAAQVRDALVAQGYAEDDVQHLGGALISQKMGQVVADIVQQQHIGRLLVSGGDTSSQTAKALSPDALLVLARFVRGAPLCDMFYLDGRPGIQVCFKGGQLGGVDFFALGRDGLRA